MDLPYLKTISQIFYQLQKSRYIADITSSSCIWICWRYRRFCTQIHYPNISYDRPKLEKRGL